MKFLHVVSSSYPPVITEIVMIHNVEPGIISFYQFPGVQAKLFAPISLSRVPVPLDCFLLKSFLCFFVVQR